MKQTGKLTILMVAVVAIGIFALPSIMSVGAGQHTFTNASSIRGMEPDKNCLRCHGTTNDDVSGELGRSDLNDFYNLSGVVGMGKIHSKIQCAHCHDISRASASENVGESHTKVPSKPLCKACHNGLTVEEEILSTVWTNLSKTSDAHSRFANETLPNAGCLGCHTRVQITGEVSYSYTGKITQLGLTIGDDGGKPNPYTAP